VSATKSQSGFDAKLPRIAGDSPMTNFAVTHVLENGAELIPIDRA
jgi:hypothetical protein